MVVVVIVVVIVIVVVVKVESKGASDSFNLTVTTGDGPKLAQPSSHVAYINGDVTWLRERWRGRGRGRLPFSTLVHIRTGQGLV